MRTFNPLPRWAAVLGSLVLAGCASHAPAADPAMTCNTRVILSFIPVMQHAPAEDFIKDLATRSDVQLTFVSTITSNMYLFRLSAAGDDSGCHDAIVRLQGDPHVRSVDLDRRRGPHG